MTLIITQISRHGIIHASDSNLSDANGVTIGTGKKCYSIPSLNAGLTVAGSFGIGEKSMDVWMSQYIESSKASSLKEFSNDLAEKLELQMTESQKSGGSLIHICGYAESNKRCHPEFWFVRNIYHMDPKTGEYYGIEKHFQVSEDFWQRDSKNGVVFKEFQKHDYMYQLYINGFTPGRISYNIIQKQLEKFFFTLWNSSQWKFRPPKNIQESRLLIENFMSMVNTAFILSDYPGQPIGGEPQFVIISQPSSIEA